MNAPCYASDNKNTTTLFCYALSSVEAEGRGEKRERGVVGDSNLEGSSTCMTDVVAVR